MGTRKSEKEGSTPCPFRFVHKKTEGILAGFDFLVKRKSAFWGKNLTFFRISANMWRGFYEEDLSAKQDKEEADPWFQGSDVQPARQEDPEKKES